MAVTAAMASLVALLGTASAPQPCNTRAGVFYDEHHSFSVDAPPGWCLSGLRGDMVFAPVETSSDLSITITYAAVKDIAVPRERLEANALQKWSVDTAARPLSTIRTRWGSTVSVWRASASGDEPARLIGLLPHETIMISFVLSAHTDAALEVAAPQFQSLVGSFRSNLKGRRTTR